MPGAPGIGPILVEHVAHLVIREGALCADRHTGQKAVERVVRHRRENGCIHEAAGSPSSASTRARAERTVTSTSFASSGIVRASKTGSSDTTAPRAYRYSIHPPAPSARRSGSGAPFIPGRETSAPGLRRLPGSPAIARHAGDPAHAGATTPPARCAPGREYVLRPASTSPNSVQVDGVAP